MAKLSPLHDVIHIFMSHGLTEIPEEESCEANGGMLRNLVDGLLPNAKRLQHIVLQTGEKHYVGPFKYFGKVSISDFTFSRGLSQASMPRFLLHTGRYCV